MVFDTAHPSGYANWAAFAAANSGATIAATDSGAPTVPFIVADVAGSDTFVATWALSNVHLGE